ncbi:hypothetical protein COO60DRAFT_754300 [Scenedesmus sp. NREL 46B-D3]|nr:hypothetical protein COO60DRAFT_754300 [Scenedesmus sp. NREL 46B-D3]
MQAAKGIKAPSLTVYLGNLDSKVTDRHLYELGCQAGPVQQVKVQHDSDTNKKGFGFITYAALDSAIYCLGLYRGLLNLFGLPVNVNFANKWMLTTSQKSTRHCWTSASGCWWRRLQSSTHLGPGRRAVSSNRSATRLMGLRRAGTGVIYNSSSEALAAPAQLQLAVALLAMAMQTEVETTRMLVTATMAVAAATRTEAIAMTVATVTSSMVGQAVEMTALLMLVAMVLQQAAVMQRRRRLSSSRHMCLWLIGERVQLLQLQRRLPG